MVTSSEFNDTGEAWFVESSSPWSVEETVQRVLDQIGTRGLKCFALVDHGAEARSVGLEMPDTKVVIFGGAVYGTPVMVSHPHAALDLPLRILIWQDDTTVKVGHTATWEFGRRFGIDTTELTDLAGIQTIVQFALATEVRGE
jgi:uncharacterized protein (DUF302 family)